MNKLHIVTKSLIISNEILAETAVNLLNTVFAEKIKTLKFLINERDKKKKVIDRTIKTKAFKKYSIDHQRCIERIQKAEIASINKEISKLRKQLSFVGDCDLISYDKKSIVRSEKSKEIPDLVTDKSYYPTDESLNVPPPLYSNKVSNDNNKYKNQSFEAKCDFFKDAITQNNEINLDELCISIAKENSDRIQEFINHFNGLDHHQQEFINCISKLFLYSERFEQERNRIMKKNCEELISTNEAA